MIGARASTGRPAGGYSGREDNVQLRWDDFQIDLDAFTLDRNGNPVPLEPKAFDLLALLVQRPGHLFTKQALFESVWPDVAVTDHALTRVIAQLRRALGDEARDARYIETVPTRGYRWVRPVEAVGSKPAAASVKPALPAIEAAAPEQAVIVVPSTTSRRMLPGLAAVLALVIVVAGLMLWSGRSEPTSANESMSAANAADPAHKGVAWPAQVTSHNGLDMQPALSPQGDAMAFVSDRSGSLELYVRALQDASAEVALTFDGGQNVQPAWSPDGKLIAYHSYRGGGIWVMPARGGVSRQVATVGSNPGWSPDGRRIAFQSDEHADVTPSAYGAQSGSTIFVVDADGGNPRELTRAGEPIGGHALPIWTPDGRRVAFTVFDATPGHEIWTTNVESGARTRLHAGKGFYELAFAPDGSALYAAGGEALIVRLPFDADSGTVTGPATYIPVPGVPGARGLTISPDGGKLAFAGLALDSQIWAQPIEPDGTPAGAARALTTDTIRRTSMPAVSPDGSKVAYTSMRRGEPPTIWVMDLDGRNRVQVTSEMTGSGDPHWFPDGQRLAFRSVRDDLDAVRVVDVRTRRTEELVKAGPKDDTRLGRPSELQLAPSGSRIAFSVVSPPLGRRVLFVSGIDPYSPRALTDGSQSVGYPAWSPDEQRVAVEIKDGPSTQAAVLDIRTGELTQLTSARGQSWVRSWSPDGRRIAVAASREGLWCLLAIDAGTGVEQVMQRQGPPRVYVRYPDWSPRGDMVVYERGELRGNIWTMAIR